VGEKITFGGMNGFRLYFEFILTINFQRKETIKNDLID